MKPAPALRMCGVGAGEQHGWEGPPAPAPGRMPNQQGPAPGTQNAILVFLCVLRSFVFLAFFITDVFSTPIEEAEHLPFTLKKSKKKCSLRSAIYHATRTGSDLRSTQNSLRFSLACMSFVT